MIAKIIIKIMGIGFPLIIGVSIAHAATDDWVTMYDQQFKLRLQQQEMQFKQIVRDMRLQAPVMTKIPIEDELSIRKMDSSVAPLQQSRFTPGTNFVDFVVPYVRTETGIVREVLRKDELGPAFIIDKRGQSVWEMTSQKTPVTELIRGVSLGFQFGAAFMKDLDTIKQGTWSILPSYTSEEFIKYSLRFATEKANMTIATIGFSETNPLVRIFSSYSYGIPDLAGLVFSKMRANLGYISGDDVSVLLNAVGKTIAGRLYGNIGALGYDALRLMAEPTLGPLFLRGGQFIFGNLAYNAYVRDQRPIIGQPFMSRSEFMKKVYGANVSTSIIPDRTPLSLTPLVKTRSFSGHSVMDLGIMKTEKYYDIKETQVIQQKNFVDRYLINNNVSLYDPYSSSSTITRQWSITTREITTPYTNITSQWGTNWNTSQINSNYNNIWNNSSINRVNNSTWNNQFKSSWK